MNKKNIIVDARMINSSGIGTYLKNILPLLIKEYNLTLLGNTDDLQKFEWSNSCKLIEFNLGIYSIQQHISYLKIPKADILWCPHINTPFLRTKTKKLITTIHDVNHLSYTKNFNFLKKVYAKMMYNNSVRKSSKIITVSNFSRSELAKHTKAKTEKINVIHCGINKVFFKNNKEDSHQSKLPENYILFVGNVKPHKNLITLLKAYSLLSNQLKSKYKLVVLGKEDGFITSDNLIQSFIKAKGLEKNIYFTGYISDNEVPSIYKKAKIFVFPSLYEGFGLPILEAMASEIPIISSNAASLPEVAQEAALYFNPESSLELKQKIEHLLENKSLRRELINKGLIQVKKFSWESAAIEHIKVFNSEIL